MLLIAETWRKLYVNFFLLFLFMYLFFIRNIKQRIISLLNFHQGLLFFPKGDVLSDPEYRECVADILKDASFVEGTRYPHHGASIYDHVVRVSYISYFLCKRLHRDYISAARGGLLHDFFQYNRRDPLDPNRPTQRLHGFCHPEIALQNANSCYTLNAKEQDIIRKHMWPLTSELPRYCESFVVSLVDKYVALFELFSFYMMHRPLRLYPAISS